MTVPRWEQRFRAPRVSLPDWAQDAPHRGLYVGNASGTFELYAWDRQTGEHHQVTDRPQGTTDGALSPDGEHVWWFDDTDGDEHGSWRRQPFAAGPGGSTGDGSGGSTDGGSTGDAAASRPDEPATPGVPDGWSAGLEIGRTATVVGCSTDDGTSIHVQRGGSGTVLYTSEHDADLAGLSRDESLVILEHSEHGDSRHRALRVLTLTGEVVADLWDGPGMGLSAVGFSPVPGDDRVLAVHEQRGRPEPLLWHPRTGEVERLELDLEGDLHPDWYEDGAALLVLAEARGRSTLHRVELSGRAAGTMTSVPTPPGSIGGAAARPDGTVEYAWSSAAEPTVIRSTSGHLVLAAPGAPAPGSVPVEDVVVGDVHALLARPEGEGPFPTVFLVHGGPTHHDTDSFASDRAAYVDLGCAVVQVNYRGSTGYGAAWRDAIEGRPGLTELEDLAAVRAWAVSSGLSRSDACVLAGGSWGGYLTLLGLGTQPALWVAGVAAVPVADYLAAYEDEMEPLRAFDRSLFGGAPEEVPQVWLASSPLTYVEHVQAPVLVLAGANDPRCPIRQIDNWLTAAAELGKDVEIYRFDAGHGSLVVDERVRQCAAELDFVARRLGLTPLPGTG